MGHIRLGVLPKTPKWRQVIALLDDRVAATQVGNAVLKGSGDVLSSPSARSCVGYCIWLLAQLTLVSKSDRFEPDLARLGILVSKDTSASDFLGRASAAATRNLNTFAPKTAFTHIAGLALRETLTSTIGARANTLFGAQSADVKCALEEYSTKKQFSDLLHVYFSALLRRTLRFVVDHEITNHLSRGGRFQDIEEMREFEQALDAFANQSSRIVDTFSGGWYSKQLWTQQSISQADAARFAHIALKKLRADLDISGGE